MNERGITKDNLLRRFPSAMAETERLAALADATAEMLARRTEEIRKLLIYTNEENMDEELLDILAVDFNVYWWDADASVEQKRRTIQTAPAVNRITGTAAALVRQVEAYYPGAKVEEWFSYGGKPGHFRVTDVDAAMADKGYTEFLRFVATVRRESSVLDAVTMLTEHDQRLCAGVGVALCRHKTIDCAHPAHSVVYLTDEGGDLLADENGQRYIDEEE